MAVFVTVTVIYILILNVLISNLILFSEENKCQIITLNLAVSLLIDVFKIIGAF